MIPFWEDPENKASFEFARALTANHAKSFYMAARLLPREQQWATFSLYGFCRYADNLVDTLRSRTMNEVEDEVANLSTEIERAYRSGESEHPVVRSFIVVAKKYKIPSEYPLTLLQGVLMDIDSCHYQTFDELYTYCYRVAGVVGLMMTYVLGYKEDTVFCYAEQLGIAMQLTNILRDIDEDQKMGRIYLPQDELARFNVNEQDIKDGKMTDNLKQLMLHHTHRAHQYYEEANKGIPLLEQKSQFTIRSASRIYRGILHRIEAQGFNPFLGRVFVPQSNKMGIILSEALRSRLPSISSVRMGVLRPKSS